MYAGPRQVDSGRKPLGAGIDLPVRDTLLAGFANMAMLGTYMVVWREGTCPSSLPSSLSAGCCCSVLQGAAEFAF
jgi:hypothetical protein